MITITYHDTLYNRTATMLVAPGTKIQFGDETHPNELLFASMGHRYGIAYQHIISIEEKKD